MIRWQLLYFFLRRCHSHSAFFNIRCLNFCCGSLGCAGRDVANATVDLGEASKFPASLGKRSFFYFHFISQLKLKGQPKWARGERINKLMYKWMDKLKNPIRSKEWMNLKEIISLPWLENQISCQWSAADLWSSIVCSLLQYIINFRWQ